MGLIDKIHERKAEKEKISYEESNKQLFEKINNTIFNDLNEQLEYTNNILSFSKFQFLRAAVSENRLDKSEYEKDLSNPSTDLKNFSILNNIGLHETNGELNLFLEFYKAADFDISNQTRKNSKWAWYTNFYPVYLDYGEISLFGGSKDHCFIKLEPAQLAILKHINGISLTKTDINELKTYIQNLNNLRKSASESDKLNPEQILTIISKIQKHLTAKAAKYSESNYDSLEIAAKIHFFNRIAKIYQSKTKSADWKSQATNNELIKIITEKNKETTQPPSPTSTPTVREFHQEESQQQKIKDKRL